jgi:hypothetical protein
MDGPVRLPQYPLSTNMLSKDGRLLTPVVTDSAWCYPPGVVDLSTGKISQIASDFLGDYHGMAWMPDGRSLSWAYPARSDLWKFAPAGR